jgi:CBS domain-containing protein
MDRVEFLAGVAPWDGLPPEALAEIAAQFEPRRFAAGQRVYGLGEPLEGLYVIETGQVRVADDRGEALSTLGPRNAFGERGLMRDGIAPTEATAAAETHAFLLPAERFRALAEARPEVREFFARARPKPVRPPSLAETRVEALMSPGPAAVPATTTIAEAARVMRDRRISSLLVTEGEALLGILTVRDVSGRVVAGGIDPARPVTAAMTKDPVTLAPDAIGSDVLHLMMERGIGHVPILGRGGVAGIVTQTDLTRFQAETSAQLVADAAHAADVDALAKATGRIPQLLAQLMGAGNRHEVVTRLVTDVADAVTRRLLAMAEEGLGPPPVPYLWLACGSQGRQEQTGTSDQDNVLMLSDEARPEHDGYFAALARAVSGGLDRAGYVFCPGDMMATNPRWRQPVRRWRDYFRGWIESPDPEAQMLASVMFDLRPIGGDRSLFEGLRADTLAAARANSIFVAHMVSNSLKHQPPLGLLRGLATLRSGEHRNRIDMKMNGVVPVVDLGRIYALRGKLTAVNTRSRLEAAREAGVVSEAGGRDLLDAYDLVAQTRLEHQAEQVRAGERPDNFLAPAALSAFERSHLRDAFVVVRTMQSAATQGRGIM